MLCCDDCHRAYHHSCISENYRQIGRRWVCEHCNIRGNSVCKICWLKIEPTHQPQSAPSENNRTLAPKESIIPPNSHPPNSHPLNSQNHMVTCSLCYCRLHQACTKIPLGLLKSRNYLLQSQNNYLCPSCVQKTKQFKILASQRYLETE